MYVESRSAPQSTKSLIEKCFQHKLLESPGADVNIILL